MQGKNSINAAQNCLNKATVSTKVARRISLRINNIPLSAPFHRKITAVPFTSVPSCNKQASIGVACSNDFWVRGMPGCQRSKLIAIIDDNESMQDSLRDLIESGGFEAISFGSAQAFFESDSYRKAVCLIVDIRMPRMSGLELQARLKEEGSNVPIIFTTAYDDAEIRAQAIKGGALEFFAKPFDHQMLLKVLRRTLDS
jgi:CheY-like chemotaxis protein